jgi:hypothetical protein
MNPSRCFLSLLLPSAVLAGTSANYTLAPDAVDNGGLRSASANYTLDGSAMPGGAGTSANYTARTGFAGQLPDPAAIAIQIAASPPTVPEDGTRQLSASIVFDDLTTTPLAPGSVTWSVPGGPLSGISPTGLATAAAVYQDTAAVARGTHLTFTNTLNLTVLNMLPDNFRTYAGDGLPDDWQVLYFGPNNPLAGPLLDPDSDGWDNLFEYNACLVPTDAASSFQFAFFPVPGHPEQKGLIFSPRFPECTYTILAGNSLDLAAATPLTGGIITDAGTGCRVIDPDSSSARKFYRIRITRP